MLGRHGTAAGLGRSVDRPSVVRSLTSSVPSRDLGVGLRRRRPPPAGVAVHPPYAAFWSDAKLDQGRAPLLRTWKRYKASRARSVDGADRKVGGSGRHFKTWPRDAKRCKIFSLPAVCIRITLATCCHRCNRHLHIACAIVKRKLVGSRAGLCTYVLESSTYSSHLFCPTRKSGKRIGERRRRSVRRAIYAGPGGCRLGSFLRKRRAGMKPIS